jgi:hypothetical protein
MVVSRHSCIGQRDPVAAPGAVIVVALKRHERNA